MGKSLFEQDQRDLSDLAQFIEWLEKERSFAPDLQRRLAELRQILADAVAALDFPSFNQTLARLHSFLGQNPRIRKAIREIPVFDRMIDAILGQEEDIFFGPGPSSLPNFSGPYSDFQNEVQTRPAMAEPPKELPPSARPPARYANAMLHDRAGEKPFDPQRPIPPGSTFRLRLDIGEYNPESAVSRPEPIPEKFLPRDIWLDVVLSSSSFRIASAPSGSDSASSAYGRFFLPADGSPAITENGGLYLYFYLTAPAAPGSARARIGYYYNNHLVQSQLFTADIGGEASNFQIVIDYSLTRSLRDIAQLPARQQISILTNSSGDTHELTIRSGDSGGNRIGQATTVRVNDDAIGPIIDNMRKVLYDRVASAQEKRRSKKDLKTDLQDLAPLGRKLWHLTVANYFSQIYPLLRQDPLPVIQVSRPTTANYTFPWSLIYDIPLSEDPRDWKFCHIVEDWDDSKPNNLLVEPGTRRCPHATRPNGAHEPNTLCPYGFWGFRYDIEQLSKTEEVTATQQIPVSKNSAFQVLAALAQYNVDKTELSIHIQALKTLLQQTFPQVNFQVGNDLLTIQKFLSQDSPFVYFFCHGERERPNDPNTYLGVGNNERIRAEDFQDWVQNWWDSDNRKVWDSIRPLIFINACHSLNIQPQTIVSFLDAFISTGNAAGVIGTEISVQQSSAMAFGLEFSRLFFAGKSVGETLNWLRTDYLSAGNMYGLIYTPYCWSNLKLVSQ